LKSDISQDVLDSLTDVDMPRLGPEPLPESWLEMEGEMLPCDKARCLVVGMQVSIRPNRPMQERKSFFERDWPNWLMGRIYQHAPAGAEGAT
jgi:hypothetical protein